MRKYVKEVMKKNNADPKDKRVVLTMWLFEKVVDDLNERIAVLEKNIRK